jgi:hypothetical protein
VPLEKSSPEGAAEMKPVRLLNWIVLLAVASLVVVWSIGYRQPEKGIEWPFYASMVCLGVVVVGVCARLVSDGKFGGRYSAVTSRQDNPVPFWTAISLFSIIGVVLIIAGAFELMNDR